MLGYVFYYARFADMVKKQTILNRQMGLMYR